MNESCTETCSRDNHDDSKIGEVDDLAVEFLKELERSSDPREVLERYCETHPTRAIEFRALAGARQVLVMSEPPAKVGAKLNDRLGDFRIVRQIARGGMGAIYEAVQEPFQRRVAVKTIRGDRRHIATGARERFIREQEVLARLHHTHIVPIHAAGQDGDLEYFAMPYIEGAALHHVVRSARNHGTSKPSEDTPSLAELALAASAGSSPPKSGDLSETNPFETSGACAQAPDEAKFILSARYLRSVANLMADAGDALHHAHQAGVIHRDVKPSNIMVDTHEHCWVVDFGLAAYHAARNGHEHPSGAGAATDGAASGIMGTPRYMAPEQFHEHATERTDIWGLGVTLYELLTLRPAFASRAEIESGNFPSPGASVGNLPRDLEAICQKALRKDPQNRYATAREFADDLRRWLGHEPVRARRARAVRRLALWAKRNKGWAAAIAFATLALAAISMAAIYITRADAARAVALAAGEKQHEAEKRAAATQREAQTSRRETLIQQMQRVRLTYQRENWSMGAWDLARRAAKIERDPRIQAEAAALLAGIDVQKVKSFALPGTAVAFNPSGKRLMIGGSNRFRREAEQPIRVWDSTTDQLQTTQVAGEGIFGFRADDTPLLLKFPRKDQSKAQLWDVTKAQVLRSFKSPLEGKSAMTGFDLTPDATLVAASARALNEKGEPGDTGMIAVWDTASGREGFRSVTPRVRTLALAPDDSLIAAGDEDGNITVWSLPKGELIATLKAGRYGINCLSFGRDPVRRVGARLLGGGWLLAAADAGGGVIVWDITKRIPRSICHGGTGSSEVLALALSPDGMTLAATGRNHVELWDIASGQLLLNVVSGNHVPALSFSPNGKQLAVGSIGAFGGADAVEVWELEPGRGIDSLRGLLSSVSTATFSPEGRVVAALSYDWHVGIWDRAAHRLLHVLEVAPGFFFDNAALAFSPDGRQLAFSAGTEASLWDVVTGEAIKTWKLPPGLVDQLAFYGPNRLLSFREETESGEVGPFSNFDPIKHPRVCRVRDMLGLEPLKSVAEIRDCNLHVFHAACSPDGRYYAVEGKGGVNGKVTRVANLYEGPTGNKLGALPSQTPTNWDGAGFNFDPTGTVLGFISVAKEARTFLLEMPSRAVRRQFDGHPVFLGPRAKRWLMNSTGASDQPSALALFEEDQREPLIKLLVDLGNTQRTGRPQISPDGLHLIWGTSGGVIVVDLVEVNRRLTELGLGW
jgi:eukaryotic-like serine/threonine-protein kinase